MNLAVPFEFNKWMGGKHSMSREGRKWSENTNQKAPDGFSRLEVFEKAATKKDDHNHPNSLQRVDYRNEDGNIDISGNVIKDSMIRAHKIILEQTNDFHWKRTMASHSRKLAQNHVAAPLRWEGIESDYGPSGQECYRGGPAHKHPPSIFPAK